MHRGYRKTEDYCPDPSRGFGQVLYELQSASGQHMAGAGTQFLYAVLEIVKAGVVVEQMEKARVAKMDPRLFSWSKRAGEWSTEMQQLYKVTTAIRNEDIKFARALVDEGKNLLGQQKFQEADRLLLNLEAQIAMSQSQQGN